MVGGWRAAMLLASVSPIGWQATAGLRPIATASARKSGRYRRTPTCGMLGSGAASLSCHGSGGRPTEGHHVTGYRCFLMSGDKIQVVQTYECADDAEVILKAKALLDSKPEHPAVEIWEGKRLVARLSRNQMTEAVQQDNVIHVVKRNDD